MAAREIIVLFDGECNLCNGTVRFLFQRDIKANLKFANLQSETGKQLLMEFSLPVEEFDSFVLVDGDRAYTFSHGVLRSLRYLRFPWPVLAKLLTIIPLFLRDKVYQSIARKRYAWFGKTDYCQTPDGDLKIRFLP